MTMDITDEDQKLLDQNSVMADGELSEVRQAPETTKRNWLPVVKHDGDPVQNVYDFTVQESEAGKAVGVREIPVQLRSGKFDTGTIFISQVLLPGTHDSIDQYYQIKAIEDERIVANFIGVKSIADRQVREGKIRQDQVNKAIYFSQVMRQPKQLASK